nr:zinc finger protein NUTCRACKER-like isoform X2 [Ipomoea batatas]
MGGAMNSFVTAKHVSNAPKELNGPVTCFRNSSRIATALDRPESGRRVRGEHGFGAPHTATTRHPRIITTSIQHHIHDLARSPNPGPNNIVASVQHILARSNGHIGLSLGLLCREARQVVVGMTETEKEPQENPKMTEKEALLSSNALTTHQTPIPAGSNPPCPPPKKKRNLPGNPGKNKSKIYP